MITTLHIKNIGIIEELEIPFHNGINVLTGETGAGKSLIIDSLAILSGGRFQKEWIRVNSEYSLVEACLYLPEHAIAEEGNIIISRQIFQNGKNLCKINGRLVTVTELKSFMKNLMDIHEQNDNQKIMESSRHIEYLDLFIGKPLIKVKERYQALYDQYQIIKKEWESHLGDEKERERTLDLLTYELNEIEQANLKEGEEEELEQKQRKFQNSQKIVEYVTKVEELLGGKILEEMEVATRYLAKVCDYGSTYQESYNIAEESYYNLQEVRNQISHLKEEVEFDSGSFYLVENRLDTIYHLKRKYGNSISEILKYKETIELKINQIENSETYLNHLQTSMEKMQESMYQFSFEMNQMRENYKVELEKEINKNLADLEMKNAKFFIDLSFDEGTHFHQNGLSKVEFKIATNLGDEYKPLIKIASGGEISRIMLAIKTILSKFDHTPIIILDEIDTGISGKAAKAVSEKIKLLSKMAQIICVTHLPVIAASADYHYYISKTVKNGKTVSNIKLLEEKEVIQEIARIATGEVTEISLQHAIELRQAMKIA